MHLAFNKLLLAPSTLENIPELSYLMMSFKAKFKQSGAMETMMKKVTIEIVAAARLIFHVQR